MCALRYRHTVLFETADQWRTKADHNETHVTVSGTEDGSITVQRRVIYPVKEEVKDEVRVTWNSGRVASDGKIVPQLLDGLNVYRRKHDGEGLPDGYIDSVVQIGLHRGSFDLEAVKGALGAWPEFDAETLKWDQCSYDINVNGTLRVDEYCVPGIEDTLVFGASKPDLGSGTSEKKLELGLFYVESSDEDSVHLSGVRCKWLNDGSDHLDKCHKTYLLYTPQHTIRGDADAPIYLEKPVGMHPTIHANMSSVRLSRSDCRLYAFMNIPVELFVDKFQQPPTLLFGEHDLELPEYKLESWGSEVLYELNPGQDNEIKLHSRYIKPDNGGRYRDISFRPFIFEACPSEYTVSENPFFQRGLGYESYFTPDTKFRHINNTDLHLTIPRADIGDYGTVQWTTIMCVLLSCAYLLISIFRPISRK
ncbi:HCL671Cp [Eremothecium sinecaudum]|uniref:Protein PBN1 n=1 Tax=Eremothecium sinecaudum TaxID=45286 RepID=A0A109UVT3_9SACH|nr:HCL671Cp [Eremothecium sinecaudum]AMD19480.1 HCL671Cp [Eremothecium sinecaudum]